MRLLMAVSADGFLARGPDDDMSWTGQTDKKLFRLLTLVDPLLLAGATTAKLLPKLPGRTVVPLSRRGLALSDMQSVDGWLIGGPTVAQEALRLAWSGACSCATARPFWAPGYQCSPF